MQEDIKQPDKVYFGGVKPKRIVPLKESKKSRQSIVNRDYTIITRLGEGAYGEVLLVQKKETGERFALKKINQHFIQKQCKAHQIFAERDVLIMFNDILQPAICGLHASFRDNTNFYFLLTYYAGGDLGSYLELYNTMGGEELQFYAAQIVDILIALKHMRVAHRDLKPNNLMIDDKGNLILIDFGTAKIYEEVDANKKYYSRFSKMMEKFKNDIDLEDRTRTESFVGTALYASPEMLTNGGSGVESDYWSFGIILYRMAFGKLPFESPQEYALFNKICDENIIFPEDIEASDALKDLISKLLCKNPLNRLGCGQDGSANDIQSLKDHEFFDGINFQNIRDVNCLTPIMKRDVYSPKKKANRKVINSFAFKKLDFDNLDQEQVTSESIKEKVTDSESKKEQDTDSENEKESRSNDEKILAAFSVKRLKFLVLEYNGELTLYLDGSIDFYQTYDKTFRKLTRAMIKGYKIKSDKNELRVLVSSKQYIFRFPSEMWTNLLELLDIVTPSIANITN